MLDENAQQALTKIRAVGSWSKKNLPLYESAIANDLVIFLAIEFTSNRALAVKRLFTSLPYSYTAIRQHYKKLFEDGWVRHVVDEKDRRIRYIKPTDKFTKVIADFVQVISHTFSQDG